MPLTSHTDVSPVGALIMAKIKSVDTQQVPIYAVHSILCTISKSDCKQGMDFQTPHLSASPRTLKSYRDRDPNG